MNVKLLRTSEGELQSGGSSHTHRSLLQEVSHLS